MEIEYDLLSHRSVLIHNMYSSGCEHDIYRWTCTALEKENIENIVWVCFNRPPYILKQIFEENNIQFNKPIWFVDMISGCSNFTSKIPGVVQCESPTDYTCLHMNIDELLDKHSKTVVVFDNLNAIMSYSPDNLTIKMMRTMNNIIPQKDSAALYLYSPGATDDRMNVTIASTVEKVYDIGGIEDKPILEFSWADIKRITWSDVFSLRHYAKWVFVLLILTIFANIMLIMTLIILRPFSL